MTKKQSKAKGKGSTKELEKKLKETEEKMNSYLNDLKRLQADFENHLKRTDKEKENISKFSQAELIKKLLPILDNFESALKSIKNTKENTLEGIQMIFNQFIKLLEEQGVKSIKSLGKKYDPYLHEAIKKTKSDEEEGTIIEEIQRGYLIHNDTLRSAKVVISNGNQEVDINSEDNQNE